MFEMPHANNLYRLIYADLNKYVTSDDVFLPWRTLVYLLLL